MIRLLKKAAIAALFVGMGASSVYGLDLGSNGSGGAGYPVPSPIDMYTTTGTVDPSWAGATINLSGNSINIGKDTIGTDDSQQLKLTITGLRNTGGPATVNIVSSLGSNGTPTGTQVTAGTVDMTNIGNLTVDASDTRAATNSDYQNQLNVTTLTGAAGSTITIGNNSLLNVTNTANTTLTGAAGNRFTLAIDGGTVASNKGLTLDHAVIQGNGTIQGDIILNSNNAGTADAEIIVNASAADATQTYKDNVTVSALGGRITVAGGAGGIAQMDVAKTLTVTGAMGNVEVGGTSETNSGNLNVNNLVLANNAQVDVDNYGSLVVGIDGTGGTTTLDGSVNVAQNGSAEFNNDVSLAANTGNVTLNGGRADFNANVTFAANSSVTLANGGNAHFANGLSLTDGRIEATTGGDNIVSVGANGFAAKGAGVVSVDGAATNLYIMSAKTDSVGANGEATGDLSVEKAGAVSLTAGGKLHANNVTVTADVAGPGNTQAAMYAAGSTGSLTAQTLTVKTGARVSAAPGVATTVNKLTTIEKDATYAVATGSNNTSLKGGLALNGTLTTTNAVAGSNTTVNIADANTSAGIVMTDGTIDARNGKITFNNANAAGFQDFNFRGDSNTILGNVDAARFNLRVNSDVVLGGNNTLKGATYTQLSGTVGDVTGGVLGNVVVGDTRTATIQGKNSVFAANAVFGAGANILGGATVKGVGNTISATKANSSVNIDADSWLDLSEGSLAFNDVSKVNLSGTATIGYTGGSVNALEVTNGSLNVANPKSSFQFTNDYLTHYYNNGAIADGSGSPLTDAIVKGAMNSGTGSWVVSNVFGDFKYNWGTSGAWLDGYDWTDLDDIHAVADQLGKNWDRPTISNGLAEAAANAAKNILVPGSGITTYNTIGDDNVTLLQALATDNRRFELTDGTTGTFDRGLLAAFNGQMAAGPVYVAQDTLRDISTTLHSRLDAYRRVVEYVNQNGIASSNALGSAGVLNERYMNRLWVGGLGTWQNADKRKGFDGWKYDGAGVMLGYDRAAGAAIFGLSASYVEGDYEDKTASGHDSKIKQYAANAYATYNFTSGMFATVMGGYSYADNNINETRGGNRAREDYHTNSWTAGARLGYDIEVCDNFAITPSVGADFFYSRANGHRVDYAGQSMWGYSAMKNHNVEIPVEVKVAYEVNMGENKGLTLMANGGYAYNLNDHGVRGNVDVLGTNVSSIRSVGRNLGHSSWKAGAGAKFRYNQWDIGVKYDYYGRSNYDAHRVTGQVGFNF